MKISYDAEADAMYIELRPDITQVKSVHLSDYITLEFGRGEVLAGIEILDAKNQMGQGQIPPVILENLKYEYA